MFLSSEKFHTHPDRPGPVEEIGQAVARSAVNVRERHLANCVTFSVHVEISAVRMLRHTHKFRLFTAAVLSRREIRPCSVQAGSRLESRLSCAATPGRRGAGAGPSYTTHVVALQNMTPPERARRAHPYENEAASRIIKELLD